MLPEFLLPPVASIGSMDPLFPSLVPTDIVGAIAIVITVLVASFLIGSIPWGVVISRMFFRKDIRSEGSGNIGATNAARTLGKRGAASVFLLDFGKGILAGWFALACSTMLGAFQEELAPLAMAFSFAGVISGHVFSPWLGFKGGKGISAGVGNIFFTFGPIWALLELALFIVIVLVSKYVSAGSVAAAVAAPFVALVTYWGHWLSVIVITIGALIIIWAHRGNISRLKNGTESRIGGRK